MNKNHSCSEFEEENINNENNYYKYKMGITQRLLDKYKPFQGHAGIKGSEMEIQKNWLGYND